MKRTARTIHRVPIDQAERFLRRTANRLRGREEYAIVEEDGVPIAGVVAMDEFEDYMELQDAELQKQIAEGYAEYQRGETQLARGFLAEVRANRAKRKKS
jgi:hypothetical protein